MRNSGLLKPDIFALFKFLSLKNKYKNINFLTIYGQHCLYSRNKNVPTNIGILSKSNTISLLNNRNPYVIDNKIKIYGCGWRDKAPKIKDGNILVIHAPITTKALWSKHKFNKAKHFLKENNNYDLILCGDIHRYFLINKNNRIICNTGPMLRLEATEYNFTHKPKFFIYDTESKKTEEKNIPHQNANDILESGHIDISNEENSIGDLYLNIDKIDRDEINILTIIDELIKQSNKEESIRNIIELLNEKVNNE